MTPHTRDMSSNAVLLCEHKLVHISQLLIPGQTGHDLWPIGVNRVQSMLAPKDASVSILPYQYHRDQDALSMHLRFGISVSGVDLTSNI